MKAYNGMEVPLHSFLTSTHGGMRGVFHAPPALSQEKALSYQMNWSLGGPQSICPFREPNSDPSVAQSVVWLLILLVTVESFEMLLRAIKSSMCFRVTRTCVQ
jgi:hypothetical protein